MKPLLRCSASVVILHADPDAVDAVNRLHRRTVSVPFRIR